MVEPGTFLGSRYEVLGQIGTGGMSDVYRASDHALNRDVAIKVLKSEFAQDGGFVGKFRTEAQSAAALEHPNIVNIYDVGSQDGLYFIVMEYVEGITLKTYIERKGKLGYNEVLSIAIQVGRGIEAAHAKGIVHRDIKPQNIMISKEGKVKVMDFGIARAATSNTINADIMGSVHYVSPEQARNGYVTYQSDIYSLGIVMYEMCTARVPFDGESTVAIAIQHLQSEMEPPTTFAPELPVSVEKIIKKCTMKSADRRYASMSELLIDLKKALVNPNEDFVVINDIVETDKTRALPDVDVARMRREALAGTPEETKPYTPPPVRQQDLEEDDGPVNSKLDKAVSIMGIAAAIVIVVLVIYLVGSFMGLFRFGPSSGSRGSSGESGSTETTEKEDEEEDGEEDKTAEQVKVPYLLGKTEDDLDKLLKDSGLTARKSGEASSESYAEGEIMRQSPEGGEMVDENTVIEYTVSSGPAEEEKDEEDSVQIPNVVGKAEADAISILTGEELKYTKDYAYSDTVPQGQVISQNPQGGETCKKGDTVALVISQGTQKMKVPNVIGMTRAAAETALKSAGLALGDVSEDYSTSSKGEVIYQSEKADSYVEGGTKVNVTISLGAKETTYSFNETVDPIDDETETYVVLYDANGTPLKSWVISESQTLSASGITTKTGTLEFYDNVDRDTVYSQQSVNFTSN